MSIFLSVFVEKSLSFNINSEFCYFFFLFVCLRLFVCCLSVCQFVCRLSVFPFIYLSRFSVSLFGCLSVSLFASLFRFNVYFLSVLLYRMSVCCSIYLSFCVSISLSDCLPLSVQCFCLSVC